MRERTEWDICIDEELVKACAELTVVGAPADDGNKGNNIQKKMSRLLVVIQR